MESKKEYYLGLDIGTDSVGYAVTDTEYNLLKFHGKSAWGSTIFDQGKLNAERRSHRSARRRLDRKQQRVNLVQEMFAEEIGKIDPMFFIRLQESSLCPEDKEEEFSLFGDKEKDKKYYDEYPTIHHLIVDLMDRSEPHDVRMVYMACAWLVAHRGHFLNNVDKTHVSELSDFNKVYDDFIRSLRDIADSNDISRWSDADHEAFGNILKKKIFVTARKKELTKLLFPEGKAVKEVTEEFPLSQESVITLLAGGTCKVQALFEKEEYSELGSISLGMDEDRFGELMSAIGDDYEIIGCLRAIYDWSVLIDILGEDSTEGQKYISKSKVKVYEQHKFDLALLKYFVKKYISDSYSEVFRDTNGKTNYSAYVYHTDKKDVSKFKKTNKDEFSKFIKKKFENLKVEDVDEIDREAYRDMLNRLDLQIFLPKQTDTDNRVIPYQLYYAELEKILDNAGNYISFIKEADADGYTGKDKILKTFEFRIPYYVGPLNPHSEKSWLVRKSGRITPWNFDEMVDRDASEEEFIRRLTNNCTYLPGENVLPKNSLYYEKFMVLDEINNIKINGEKISVELKQQIYNDLFLKYKKVSKKKLTEYLVANNYIEKGEEDLVTGIDIEIRSNLSTHIAFKNLLNKGLSEKNAEEIIKRSAYAEDKTRLKKWLDVNYPEISDEDKTYICRIRIKDFGRLSYKFLCELEGADKETGEVFTFLGAMWNTQNNHMELLSDSFTFSDEVKKEQEEYYSEHNSRLSEKLDDMYISNSVKRPVFRTMAIVKDVEKAFEAPKKIFVEMTRGSSLDQRVKRTSSRLSQILKLYEYCKDEDVRILKQQLEAMGERADNRLQGNRLFLYYMQLGKCMYSGESININRLSEDYNIEHIYPQAYVKDDSIINNLVLVKSGLNGEKSDTFPIELGIRKKMTPFWRSLKEKGMISEEKYRRLTRNTTFDNEEKLGFINRQLTETSQGAKAVAEILKEKFPDTEIVYCKAGLTSEFRQEFGLLKSRLYNDLHHAVDAYLNIVTGNVYSMKFNKKWFRLDQNYSIKTKILFTHPQRVGGREFWNGTEMLEKVKKIAQKNTAHFTEFSYVRKGGLFDQQIVKAGKGQISIKKNMDIDKYGGYNKATVSFFVPVKYTSGKKKTLYIMSVECLYAGRFLDSEEEAIKYAHRRMKQILGKGVTEISFPMGRKPWKINTMLSLDGFRVCISGVQNGAKLLVFHPSVQFSSDSKWSAYLKKMESFVEKNSKNPKYVYDADFDKVNAEENIALYDLYVDKLENSIYKKRSNIPTQLLKDNRGIFVQLDILRQCRQLLEINKLFNRAGSGGVNLVEIGGKANAAVTTISCDVSNWGKKYSDVRVINQSPSGLWEQTSVNLLELL